MSVQTIDIDGVPTRIRRPETTPTAAVLVLHQALGYSLQTDEWLNRLAERGYLAAAPLLLHHHGVETVDPAERFGGDLSAFSAFLPGDDLVQKDVDAVLNYVVASGVRLGRIGALGFSYGGRAAYLTGTRHPLGAAVTYYGNGIGADGYPANDRLPALTDNAHLRTPWLGLYGEQDFLLTPGELDNLEALLAQFDVESSLVRYPEAGHAFDIDLAFTPGAPSSLVEEASEDAMTRTPEFLDARLS